ncbi:aminotransferase class I/II-fold pyridoxal phosphate-dependent enzyme [Promicromonospora thailandica]|uniref:DNA-binding transcriptional regulator, MocR family, contains an aminotransferase domain n=1 Tax=Promicromonospora thailandica TaxID=765201 RepID=A0A9X2JV42_9MICO|nr:aminotransferase class I/II-fold pyridoxal phosphate-dependent enzyme [Promicromonospora thailandica]MCP2264661.1 DNA-binding transcriptional regulator, MocR family, contains an aminotransferase domain [Promicromonospora thailandica]BFF20261.1 aminotransferase class I/II-fold pyridoxal phosphate-dependent enzyme [Promicromonospora thailandica]
MTTTTSSPATATLPPLAELQQAYAELQARGLKLDLTRGKPSAQQLDLAEPMLDLPGAGTHTDDAGTDTRNYGGLDGGLAIRRIFAELLDVPVEQLLAGGNASLTLMHDVVAYAELFGFPESPKPWAREETVRWICPVPGYDRHFTICEALGIEMIPVPMTVDGPDAEAVAALVADDPTVKGMWVVPTYSNPDGAVITEDVARALVSMPAAAPDFRILWDNAYAVHHLTDDEVTSPNALALAAQAGNPDRVVMFASTSKITFAGAGVSFLAGSPATIAWYKKHLSAASIGPDKINHLRHAMFFGSADGVREHMRKHREILAPKFEAVVQILAERLGAYGIASWTEPKGGYFVSLDVAPGTASRVVELAKDAGIALTPAGATHPYGKDPENMNVRLAPSMPPLDEVRTAMDGVATCVLLAAAESRS